MDTGGDEGDQAKRTRAGEAQLPSSSVAAQPAGVHAPSTQAGSDDAMAEDIDAMHVAERLRKGAIFEPYSQVRVADHVQELELLRGWTLDESHA